MKQSDRKKLENRAYARHNLMISDRSERQQLEGSNFEPLILECYEFDHEWVGMQTAQLCSRDNLVWELVDHTPLRTASCVGLIMNLLWLLKMLRMTTTTTHRMHLLPLMRVLDQVAARAPVDDPSDSDDDFWT